MGVDTWADRLSRLDLQPPEKNVLMAQSELVSSQHVTASALPPSVPQLSQAREVLTHGVRVRNEFGETQEAQIPTERPLTLYLDKQELVPLMTVGAAPELLALGYLCNQRLVHSIADIASVQVDWEVETCSITSRSGIADLTQRTAGRRVVTTGCGQSTVYASLMDEVDNAALERFVAEPLERLSA